jgi:hypothetical protein
MYHDVYGLHLMPVPVWCNTTSLVLSRSDCSVFNDLVYTASPHSRPSPPHTPPTHPPPPHTHTLPPPGRW